MVISGISQYMCKELFVMDFNTERCKESVYISLFLLVTGEDKNFKHLQSSHRNLAQAIVVPVK